MTPADDYRSVAAGFTSRVLGAPDDSWDNQSPVEDWRARDVVRHLVEWLPAFLDSVDGPVLATGPSVDDDPVQAWLVHDAAVQAVLDDPDVASREIIHQHIGTMALQDAIAMIYTNDVFMHTWDLARATGQDDTLDATRCAEMFAGMEPMDEMLRASGQYGPRIVVPPEADAQTQLMAFIGRTP